MSLASSIAKALLLSLVVIDLGAETAFGFGLSSGKERLEQVLSEKLDRILTSEEYLIDLKVKPAVAGTTPTKQGGDFLPGLQVLGSLKEGSFDQANRQIVLDGKADLLLVFDTKVSKERMRVAQDIVSRIIDAENLKTEVKISTQQKDIRKTPAPVEPPPAPKQPSLLDELIRQREFVTNALILVWCAVVSLMAIYFGLRKLLQPAARSGASEERYLPAEPHPASTLPLQQASGLKTEDTAPKTREQLYSKDEAFLGLIRELSGEAKDQPKKVAVILSRWVSLGDETSRQAAIFLKNCDIKTVEAICRSLHPTDLEKIISFKIEDFEPFGPENQRVIERMRGDFAVLASEQLLREKPDPLHFMKVMGDEDIRLMLEGESVDTVALVATQLPAQRLQRYYAATSPELLSAILEKLSKLQSTSVQDLEVLRLRLSVKAETIASSLFSERDRSSSILQMIAGISSPGLQVELMGKLRRDNLSVYQRVRPAIVMAPDLRFLPGRVKTILIQGLDADTLGYALSEFKFSFADFTDGLPPAYVSVFNDARSRRNDPDVAATCWKKVSSVLTELVSSGIVTRSEIETTILRSDQSEEETSSDSNAPLESLSAA